MCSTFNMFEVAVAFNVSYVGKVESFLREVSSGEQCRRSRAT